MEKRLNTHGQRQTTSEHTQGLSQNILLVEVVQSRSDPYLYSFFYERYHVALIIEEEYKTRYYILGKLSAFMCDYIGK